MKEFEKTICRLSHEQLAAVIDYAKALLKEQEKAISAQTPGNGQNPANADAVRE